MKVKISVILMVLFVALAMSCNKDKNSGGGTSLEKIKFEKSSYSVAVDKTINLKVVPVPSDATLPELTFESDDEDIAEVDSKGKVKGIEEGEVTITATSKDGKFKAECTVKVTTGGGGGGDFSFEEPCLLFGKKAKAIKDCESRELIKEHAEYLNYAGENDFVDDVWYYFGDEDGLYADDELSEIDLFLFDSPDTEKDAMAFLNDKYTYLQKYQGFEVFTNDEKTVLIGFGYVSDFEEWVVFFVEPQEEKTIPDLKILTRSKMIKK